MTRASLAPSLSPSADPVSMPADRPLLEVEGLTVRFPTPTGIIEAVRGVSFTLGRERLGIVGESGSGKSQTGRAILGLTAAGGEVNARRLAFDGIDLMTASEATRRHLRGRRMTMVMQDPKFSLNPVMSVGRQIVEAIRVNLGLSRRAARDRGLDMLRAVRIEDPKRVFDLYPFEISGGMGQRVMIAMMLATGPDLLIADEPTSALDVGVRQQVLAILDELVAAHGLGLIFISHDLRLVASFCDRVLVMYAGRVVEEIASARDLVDARHPYTRGLLECVPSLAHPRHPLPTLQRDAAWAR